MKRYDLVVVGGGIAGSVTARFAADQGMKVLLVERARVPRNKVCTGLQFDYFQKLVGATIPAEKLCRNALTGMQMVLPSGLVMPAPMHLLNFWRTTFDAWLNELAVEHGAEFLDETIYQSFRPEGGNLRVLLETRGTEQEVETRYLVGADGANSRMRKQLRPQDFAVKAPGGIWCYYFAGDAFLDPETVYMFYNVDFSTSTFGTVYRKDDEWLIATGADRAPKEYIERFFRFLKEKYWLRGKITRREGFASTLIGGPWLGSGQVLLAGDAAGLLDPLRVLGMDNAALSGRLLVKAVLRADDEHRGAVECYQEEMADVLAHIAAGARKQSGRYKDNQTLEASLMSLDMLRSGMFTLLADVANRFLPPEEIIELPA